MILTLSLADSETRITEISLQRFLEAIPLSLGCTIYFACASIWMVFDLIPFLFRLFSSLIVCFGVWAWALFARCCCCICFTLFFLYFLWALLFSSHFYCNLFFFVRFLFLHRLICAYFDFSLSFFSLIPIKDTEFIGFICLTCFLYSTIDSAMKPVMFVCAILSTNRKKESEIYKLTLLCYSFDIFIFIRFFTAALTYVLVFLRVNLFEMLVMWIVNCVFERILGFCFIPKSYHLNNSFG